MSVGTTRVFKFMRGSLIFLACLVVAAVSYEKEGNVLELEKNDFPSVLEEFPHMMIEFYTPWCGHCKTFAPIYDKAATLLARRKSPVKMAKVDSTEHPQLEQSFPLTGYPTLYFVSKGYKVKFDGTRTSQSIIDWIDKRMTPRTSEIHDTDELAKLAEGANASLVLYSSDEKDINKFNVMSTLDDFNAYYIAVGDLAKTYSTTVVEIHRNFDEPRSVQGIDDLTFPHWRRKYERPLEPPFDSRTIRYIFQQETNALILLNVKSDKKLTELLQQLAANLNGDFIITELRPNNLNFNQVAEFAKLKMDGKPKLFALKSKEQRKAIYWGDVNKATYTELRDFINSVAKGRVKLYDQEQVIQEPPEENQNYTQEEL